MLVISLLFSSASAFATHEDCANLINAPNSFDWDSMLGALTKIIGSSEPQGYGIGDLESVVNSENPQLLVISRVMLFNKAAFGHADSQLARHFVWRTYPYRSFPTDLLTYRRIARPHGQIEYRRAREAMSLDQMFGQLARELWKTAFLRLVREQPFVMLTDKAAIETLVLIRFTHRDGARGELQRIANHASKEIRPLAMQIQSALEVVEKSSLKNGMGFSRSNRCRGIMH